MVRLVAAALLCAAPALADPMSPAEARVALERHRARYAEALDAAAWRRDAPAVRAVADEVTGEALALLEVAPGLYGEVSTLVRDAAGAPLGPWIAQHTAAADALLGAWLRDHDDPALLAAVAPRDPSARLAIAQEVALTRPVLAAELVADGLRASNPRLGDYCAVANALPDAQRRTLAALAWQASRVELFADCLVLVAAHPALRRDLALRALAELERPPPEPSLAAGAVIGSLGDELSWPLVTAAVVTPAVAPALASRLRAAIARRDDLAWSGALSSLARVAPWLQLGHPASARLFDEVERASPGARSRVELTPARARVTLPVAPRSDAAARHLALATPRDGSVAAVAALRAVGANAAQRAYDGRVTLAALDAWIEALERAARCADDACLRALVRDGGDETAARAAWLLGPQRLAALPADDARALVRRLALEVPVYGPGPAPPRLVESSSLARVVYGGLSACPDALRGLASVEPFDVAQYDDPVAPWRRAFAARCHARAVVRP